jgi:protein SCO1
VTVGSRDRRQFLAALGAFATTHAWAESRPVRAGFTPPKGRKVGGVFELNDQDGRPFLLGASNAQPTLLFFGFTQCPAVCPTALLEAKHVVARVPADRAPRVVFVTLDPERDTPDVLKAYVGAFDPRFVALSASPKLIAQVADAYLVSHRRVATGRSYTIDHSAYVYFLDESGTVQRLYAHGTPAAVIAGDIERAPVAAIGR